MSKRVTPHDGTGVIVAVPGIGILQAYGITVPGDASAGYATGCIFHHTDGGDNTAAYVNIGNATSADFDALTNA